jgi:hypothetical protein
LLTPGESERTFRRRLLLAFGLAIAIHEIVIGAGGFLKLGSPATSPEPLASVQIEVQRPIRVAVVTPAPTPTATPTPPPKATPAVRRVVAAPRATAILRVHSGGSKGGPKLEVHLVKTAHHREDIPVRRATPQASKIVADAGTGPSPTPGPGAGNGEGAGKGNGAGSATGGGGGTGGNGSGVAAADAPCGTPMFYGLRAKYNPRDGSFDEDVRVELQLGNGEKLAGDFHYPWHYPNEAQNPFSAHTQIPEGDPIPAQLPPPGFDVSKEPLAVQLTLKYTTPNGTTRFEPCPEP